MEPDKFQQAWQAQSAQTRVTVDADLLRKEVLRNQREFRAKVFARDFREVLVALAMIPVWFYLGIKRSLPWTWYLTVPALVWIVGFFLVDRMRHKQKPIEPGEPLRTSVRESLTEIEHQIWLLRNVFWWYLLPTLIPMLAFVAQVGAQVFNVAARDLWDVIGITCLNTFILCQFLAVFYFLDYINQRAVRLQLEPRRQELLTLLAHFGDDSAEPHGPINDPMMNSATSVASPRLLRRWLIVAVLCLLTLVPLTMAGRFFESNHDGPPRSSGPAGDSLARLVTEQRKQKNLVGLAAMVTIDGQVEAAVADGERKKRSGVSLEIGDRWHLGGITKAITATMIARLIESGQMKWSDTIGEIFPEASIHKDWRPVTLRQLLTDTAGAPPQFSKAVSRRRPPLGPECTEARREVVLNVMVDKPAYPLGEKFAYSNVGYTIAAAMAEKVTGATWEDLVKREVFEPLKLADAGFGPPKSADETLEQPRGHRAAFAGKTSVDDQTDNTSIMGPSGSVNMSLENLCTFAREHMLGTLGEGKLLSAETYKLLQTPELDHYACGWIKKESSKEIPYTVYWHNGSNTMWYALVVFIPAKNMVVAVTANDGDFKNAEAAAWEIVKAAVTETVKDSLKQPKVEAEDPSPERDERQPATRRSS